ncbi:leucyl/phenylalanyl-tRNA--protein transferase, partial [Salmonella enterica]
QVLNSHTASLGAIEIPRRDYLDHLAALRQQPLASRFWVPRTLFLPRK